MQTNELTKGMTRVFVYGSLKRGHSNHGLLESAKYVGRDMVLGPFEMYSLGYFPGVVDKGREADISPIYGEVYEVDKEGLAALDLLEGHPDFYCREKLTTENGVRAWMYVWKMPDRFPKDEQVIPSGMWSPTDEETEYWKEAAGDGSDSNAA